jgi:hypothetical protein
MINFKKSTPDTILHFLRSTTIGCADSTITAKELFEVWRDWCRTNRYYAFNPNWFGKKLTALGLERTVTPMAHQTIYVGLRWKMLPESLREKAEQNEAVAEAGEMVA